MDLIELQGRIAQGDEQAFEALYRRFHSKLITFSRSLVKTRELAEEIVEDVFVKLWCRRESVNGIRNLTVYLYCATRNQSLNALSSEARQLVTEVLDLTEAEVRPLNESPHDLFVTSEIMQLVQQTIDLLPKRCRMIFQLVREDGLKYKEVAEILNISVNTIDAQMAIAVKRLCAALGVEQSKKRVLNQ